MSSLRVLLFSTVFCFAFHLNADASRADTVRADQTGDNSPVTTKCTNTSGGGFWWHYCVLTPKASQSKDVLYYFHGLYGSEYEWQYGPYFSKIYQTWGAKAPTVVTITYGSLWLLAQKNDSNSSGLYENFVNTALPGIERTENLHPAHRLLMGLSMGGFNASQVYLKNPELFSKVALACPAITSVGPYDSSDVIQNYITRTGATPSYVYNAIYLSSIYFINETDWSKADPLSQAASVVNANYPALYASGGLQDQYGFFDGTEAFVKTINAHGAKATWTPVQGLHCSFDVEGTARFLIAE